MTSTLTTLEKEDKSNPDMLEDCLMLRQSERRVCKAGCRLSGQASHTHYARYQVRPTVPVLKHKYLRQ